MSVCGENLRRRSAAASAAGNIPAKAPLGGPGWIVPAKTAPPGLGAGNHRCRSSARQLAGHPRGRRFAVFGYCFLASAEGRERFVSPKAFLKSRDKPIEGMLFCLKAVPWRKNTWKAGLPRRPCYGKKQGVWQQKHPRFRPREEIGDYRRSFVRACSCGFRSMKKKSGKKFFLRRNFPLNFQYMYDMMAPEDQR